MSITVLELKNLQHIFIWNKSILYTDWTNLFKNCDSHFDLLPEPLLHNYN